MSYFGPLSFPKLSYFFPKFVLFGVHKNARNALEINAFRALSQNADSINRPCYIVLLVFTLCGDDGGRPLSVSGSERGKHKGGMPL